MKIRCFSELVMRIDGVLLDVLDDWDDDLMSHAGINKPLKDDVRGIITFNYNNDNNRGDFTLFENGEIFRTKIENTDNGYTWNGDDVYIKSYSQNLTYQEKVGQIDIDNDLDYSAYENIENIVCQLIEIMRDI